MPLYLGCPMWALKTWVGNFFPPKSKAKDFLALYSRRLNTVEGNTTFYATPDAATVERWRNETPPGFRFCLKFPQIISHRKRLRNCEAETREFLDRLERLGDRCGPAFLQLPPTFSGRHLDTLAAYLAALPRDFRFAVEPRHADFFGNGTHESQFNELLARYRVARVIFDTTALFSLPNDHSDDVTVAQGKKPRFPTRRTRTAPFAFIRFVGQPEIPNNRPSLAEWASHVAQWLQAGDDVFFFHHNPNDTHSPVMARLFHALVNERYGIPPLPEWDDMPEPKQAGLL